MRQLLDRFLPGCQHIAIEVLFRFDSICTSISCIFANLAKKSKNKAEKLLQEHDDKIQSAITEGKNIITKSVDAANTQAKNDTQSAKVNSIKEIENKKSELAEQKTIARQKLEAEVSEIANKIMTKVMK